MLSSNLKLVENGTLFIKNNKYSIWNTLKVKRYQILKYFSVQKSIKRFSLKNNKVITLEHIKTETLSILATFPLNLSHFMHL